MSYIFNRGEDGKKPPKQQRMYISTNVGFAGWANRKFAFGWAMRVKFYRHMAAQLANERPAVTAMEDFYERLVRRNKKDAAGVMGDMIRRMKNGVGLSGALAAWVPPDEALIISSGEQSGELSRALDLAIDARERVTRVRRVLLGAMVQPGIYLAATYVMLWVIGATVLPTLSGAIPESRAQGIAKSLYTLGAMATSWQALIPPVLACMLVAVVFVSLPRWRGPWRVMAENYFPYSFYRDMNGYTWLLGFSALLRAGMPDVEILRRQVQHASPWLVERLIAIRTMMEDGASLSMALRGQGKKRFGFPNPDMIDDIQSMNGFPDFSERIAKVATQWADELERRTTRFGKAFGLAAELAMYGALGFLVFAINSLSTQLSAGVGM